MKIFVLNSLFNHSNFNLQFKYKYHLNMGKKNELTVYRVACS